MRDDEKKFLFYYVGKPVYEGDETHIYLERCRKEFGGDMIKMTKHDAKDIVEFFKKEK